MNHNINFWKSFSRRSAFCFFIILLLFLIGILRVAVIATDGYSQAQITNNRLTLTVSKQRGTIFDCNMIPITNQTQKIIGAVSPTPRAVTAISQVLSGEELENALERLKGGKPILCELPEVINCDGIVCTQIFVNSDENLPSAHLIGYTDSDLKGMSGLQKAYDSLLYSQSEIKISYECNGKGSVLEGVSPTVIKDSSVEASGVVSTLDINIQNIAERNAAAIDSGAIVIAEAKTGKIRACVSRPDFDITNISAYLDSDGSPLLNRAINSYNVGSVFKPCVAIAGIESDKNNFLYTCTGSCEIIDRYFKCHKADGHGIMNLHSAIANSCNTFFYNFSFKVGKKDILNTAQILRFGQELKLCDGMNTSAGNLPSAQRLENIAQLANFSIGQGELLLSPVSILTLYCAIANDGKYYIPSIVEGTVTNGSFKEYNIGNPTHVMKSETAALLRQYLMSVLTEGTGESALPKTTTAAGKTATAQTGKYENGVEICQGWFCGFFPAENPEYVAVVFSENTKKQSLSCAEIFACLADDTMQLKRFK